ncbi:CDP-glycerol glycerophosphotransferase family protein [Virgibacillus sp. W0430]|uniref:CDP-glycerol glycerophosphotransferase family protein n=1 Tax=Virgibacillus sp. W0430 TaxID=3391580 RepID=UPI003F48BF82
MNQLKLVPTIIVKFLLRFVYSVFCLFFNVKSNKVTFASYRSDRLTDNLCHVHKKIGLKYPSFERHIFFKRLDSTFIGKVRYIIHMIHACYHLATSRYFIVDDYYFPLYVLQLRKEVEVIQLWHSSGAFKKFGLSTIGKTYGPSKEYLKHVNIHGNYSKAFVSTERVIPFYGEAFGMPHERIYPLGIPRTDYFYQKEEIERFTSSFYNSYSGMEGKKIILYAPTFRGKSHHQNSFSCPIDLERMHEHLSEEYVLLIHLHPYMRNELSIPNHLKDFVINIQDTSTIMELLVLTDILITDYSSVFFDYSLLKRPMIFFAYDLEDYIEERDFYYNYRELVPGPIVIDTESIVKTIKEDMFNINEITEFSNRFFDFADGKATERIVDCIMSSSKS